MTVGELAGRMDAAEFLEWGQYDEVHTPDEWTRTALLCLTMVRLVGNKQATLADFLPARREPEAPAPAPGEVNDRLLAWARARVAAQQGRRAQP